MSLAIIDARQRDLGGFQVGRVLPQGTHRAIGPFVFFDHMGPMTFSAPIARERDIRPHPHVGLATITYLFAGEIMHRDSTGAVQLIRPGEVNWMTAGRGITHSERFDSMREHGGALHGIQAWIALPLSHEDIEPSFIHYSVADLPAQSVSGATLRVIAGEVNGARSPVPILSALHYAHLQMAAGSDFTLAALPYDSAVFVAAGAIQSDQSPLRAGQMLLLPRDVPLRMVAPAGATVMLLGGESVGERLVWWNFVTSNRARMEDAKHRWRSGAFALPAEDSREFIPLPEA